MILPMPSVPGKRAPSWGLVRSPMKLAVLLLALFATTAGADDGSFMVATEGELIRVVSGTYGELFPKGLDARAEAQVLALEVVAGDDSHLLLVPGTESVWPESSARLIADERAGFSYLIWESRAHGVHPLLNLVTFDGSEWGEVKEIQAGVFADKGEPQLRVTHDYYGDETPIERTVLHVSWWEYMAGAKEKRYAFLVMEDGKFVDSYQVVDLTAVPGGGSLGESKLESLVRMQSGSHKDMVVLGYFDPSVDQVASLQVEVLPQALSRLSDQLKLELAELPESSDAEAARAAVERALAVVADDFHGVTLDLIRRDLLGYLAELTRDSTDEIPLTKMGARVIWIGAKVGRGGLAVHGDPQLMEIADEAGSHHLAITRLTSWASPETGENPSLFLSRDGSEALVAWLGDNGSKIEYRETDGGIWSELQSIQMPFGIEADQAMHWLEQKALNR